jgi:hypothetical protein
MLRGVAEFYRNYPNMRKGEDGKYHIHDVNSNESVQAGWIEFVQIESRAGGECRLRNPWPDATVTLWRDGKKGEGLTGDVLVFPTDKNETIVVVPQGSTPSTVKIL